MANQTTIQELNRARGYCQKNAGATEQDPGDKLALSWPQAQPWSQLVQRPDPKNLPAERN